MWSPASNVTMIYLESRKNSLNSLFRPPKARIRPPEGADSSPGRRGFAPRKARIRPPEGADSSPGMRDSPPPEGAIGQSRLRGDAHLNEFLMKIRNYREKFVARHGDRSPHPPFRCPKAAIRIVAVSRSLHPRHGRFTKPPRVHRAAMFASWVRRERAGGITRYRL